MKRHLSKILLLTLCIALFSFLTPLNALANVPRVTDTLTQNTDVLRDIDQF